MPTRNEMFPSKWLKASDVEPPVVATVDTCHHEVVGQGAKAERKPILSFHDKIKPHILNQTNWDSMVALTGYDDSDDWTGASIELFAIDVVGPNGPTRGIRIRRPKTTKKPARRAVAPDRDDIAETMPTFAKDEAF